MAKGIDKPTIDNPELREDARMNLLLARKTEWSELQPEVWAGLGQRMLGSDAGDHALMDVREIVFGDESSANASAAPAATAQEGTGDSGGF